MMSRNLIVGYMFLFWLVLVVKVLAHDPHPGSFDRKGTDCSVFEGDMWYMCQKMNALSSHVARMDADLMAHTRARPHTSQEIRTGGRAAREAGVWQSRFDAPWEWRAARR